MSRSFFDMSQFGTSAWSAWHAETEHHIRLTSGDDTYRAGDGGEHILGLDGNDLIIGGAGDDTVIGGSGDDELYGARKGKDHLDGGTGDDRLYGSRGHDELFGGRGDDDLHGDAGPDIMDGGEGRDRIDVNPNDSDGARDIIVYHSVSDSWGSTADQLFVYQTGEDRIDLSAIDADPSTLEDDAFTFIGHKDFSGVAGELRFDGRFVLGDVDGDGHDDLRIEIASFTVGSSHTLHARDIVL